MIGDEDEGIELDEDQINENDLEGDDEEEPASAPEEDAKEGDEEQHQDETGTAQKALLKGSQEPAEKTISRSSRAIMQAKAAAKAANEKAEAVERELASLRAERQQATQQITERERQERLALMTSEERMEFHLQELRAQQEQFQRNTIAQQADQADRAAYQAKAASDPRYKKYEADVERELQLARSRGLQITREGVLAFVLGHKILTGDKGAIKAAKAAGAARVSGQKTNPGGSASDQGRTRAQKSLRERLEGVTF